MFYGLSNTKKVIRGVLCLLYEHHSLALRILHLCINVYMHIFEMSLFFQRVLKYRVLGWL